MQLPKLIRDERGQAEAVTLQLTLIISLVVAIIVVYQLFISGVGPTSDQYVNAAAVGLTNTDFADNSDNATTFSWDNYSTDNVTNAWNSGGYVTTRVEDNDNAVTDNGYWYQSLTLSTVGDGVSVATLTARYRLIENGDIQSITSYVILDDGTDNTTIWQSTSVENSASWTSIENSVLDNVDAAGTYTVFLRTDVLVNGQTLDNIIVGWDDVNLSVTAETANNPNYDANALAAFNNVVTLAWAGIGLMAVAIIIIAASVILGVVRGFGGAAGRGV